MVLVALSRPLRSLLTRRHCRTYTTGVVTYEALLPIPSVGKLDQPKLTTKEETLVVRRMCQKPLVSHQLGEIVRLLVL